MSSTDLIISFAFNIILFFAIYLLAGRSSIEYLHGMWQFSMKKKKSVPHEKQQSRVQVSQQEGNLKLCIKLLLEKGC